ncbi:MAG: 5'-nucleotidase C-terminal domain-containing protein [Lachnospiraceae bacterium]|nr:5'-nucleotidase C-terminal domain-containing protein [Lachnospiraceae bacterium]
MRLLGVWKNKVIAGALSMAMVIGTMSGVSLSFGDKADAADADVANLRLIYTSDVHGQITTDDFENASVLQRGGLSRAYTVIKNAKSEVNASNSMLFDLGDALYDYTTDYIYNSNSSAKQPVFTALSKIGYDAMVLGNHDFDMDLNYIQTQLKGAGLTGKIVLSNVTDTNTGKHVWAENKIITKNIVTESGKTISVKVGLIGETVPKLSKKRTSYKGVLTGEDIVNNVKKEVTALKSKGADIIVVLAHSGIGEEKPELNAVSVGYALTKISGVDAVLCGHAHRDFPNPSGSSYDNLPGVNLKTGLTNGKPLIQVVDRAGSVGVVDLKITQSGNKPTITGASTDVRKVTSNITADQTINNCLGSWSKTFIADCSQILSEVDSSADLQSYFGTMEDTDAIQLLNMIKMSYGLKYINTTGTAYKNLPVVAASTYIRYGSGDGNDYVDIQDDFKKSDIYNLVTYKTGLYMYKLTGAQIKEWLEWSASCYEQAGKNVLREGGTLDDTDDQGSDEVSGAALEVNTKTETKSAANPLLNNALKTLPSLSDIFDYDSSKPFMFNMQEDYIDDWSKFYIFDGLEYEIDTKIAPRYNEDGDKINDTRRVVSLTRNGKAVADKDNFIVMTHEFPKSNAMYDSINATKIMNTPTLTYMEYIQSYIEKISMTGTIKSMKDDNWRAIYSEDYNYLVQSGVTAERYLGKKDWLVTSLGRGEFDEYYLVDPAKQSWTDTTGPCLNVVIQNESETNKNVPIIIQATDRSGIASIRYATGKYNADNTIWNTATKISGNVFNCSKNGTYTICATDGKGNRSVATVKVLNINKSMLSAPVVDTFTNRKKAITGKAEANARVYFKIEGGATYSTVATKKGTFSCNIPAQKAGKRIFVYVVDSKGMTSSRTIVTVKRTGPNKPTLNKVYTNKLTVTGNVNDTYAYPMVLVDNKTVYVANKNVKALYLKSGFYSKKYKVKIGNFQQTKAGKFTLTLSSYLKANTSVKLRTVDSVSRESLLNSTKTVQAKPIKPTTSVVKNNSKKVKVYTSEICTKAAVKIGKKTYTTKQKTYNTKKKKYCFTIKIPRTDSTTLMKVFTVNAKGRGSALTIYPVQKVPDTPRIITADAGKTKVTGTVNLVGAKKNKTPTVSNTKTKVVLKMGEKEYKAKIKKDGTFSVKVPKLKAGDKFTLTASNRAGKSKSLTVKIKKKKSGKKTNKTDDKDSKDKSADKTNSKSTKK